MKATLEFNLPEETHEHELAINAATMYSAICDLDNHLRNVIKHGDQSEMVKRFANEIRNDYLSDIKDKLE
jgi:hypothetical protein